MQQNGAGRAGGECGIDDRRAVCRPQVRRRTQPKALNTPLTHPQWWTVGGGRQPPQGRFDCRHQIHNDGIHCPPPCAPVRMHPPQASSNGCDDDGQETINWI
jgi:hypothetical protein